MLPKPLFLQGVWLILVVLLLHLKLGQNGPKHCKNNQDGLVARSGPDSTDHNTPSRTDDRKTFAYVEPPT